MARTSPTKIRILAIERMLANGKKYNVYEIQEELERKYEIYAERKTIYDDLYALSMFVPIETKAGHDGGFQRTDVLERCKNV